MRFPTKMTERSAIARRATRYFFVYLTALPVPNLLQSPEDPSYEEPNVETPMVHTISDSVGPATLGSGPSR